MKISPLPGWLIAQPCKIKQKITTAGIIIPDKSAEGIRFVLGKVIAASDIKYLGNQEIPSHVKVGDFIYFDEVSTRDFTWNQQKYFAIQEEKIYGVVELTGEEKQNLEMPDEG